MRRTQGILVGGLVLAAACSGDAADAGDGDADSADDGSGGPPVVRDLVEPEAWEKVARDPADLADHRPADFECEAGYHLEYGQFEVDTDDCTYGSFEQPALAEILEGDELRLVILHEPLAAPDVATAHFAVAVDGEVLWEQTFEIPAPDEVLAPTWESTSDAGPEVPVHLHLHNHGFNSWKLLSFTATTK